MFSLFKDAAKRTAVQNKVRDIVLKSINLDINKIGGWKLAKITDSYFDELKSYSNATDYEELFIYLMLLHDAHVFDRLENEMILGFLIKIVKHEESKMATDGYKAFFRQSLRSRIDGWIHSRILM